MSNKIDDEIYGIREVQTKTMPKKKHLVKTNKLINDLACYRKDILIQLLGGVCKECGYIYPQCAMDFHHVIKKEKDELAIGIRLRQYSEKGFWERVLPDVVEKCILLCANCHREKHFHK